MIFSNCWREDWHRDYPVLPGLLCCRRPCGLSVNGWSFLNLVLDTNNHRLVAIRFASTVVDPLEKTAVLAGYRVV